MDEIATRLRALIEGEVAKRLADDANWRERYEMLKAELESMRDEAQALYDDMKSNGLTASSIEAEGYLRGCIHAVNLVDN